VEIPEANDDRPVSMELHDHLLEPFVAAVSTTVAAMANTEVVARAERRTGSPRTLAEISAVIELTSAVEGAMALCFPQSTALSLARRILAEIGQEPDAELVADCMGEIANVVVGQAKALLAGSPYWFTFSPPRVIAGAGHDAGSPADREGLVVVFDSDAGEFALLLALHK
jgi:CheY-specific phosphatase CheX